MSGGVAQLASMLDHVISIINLTLNDLLEHFNVFFITAPIANKSAYVNKFTPVSTQRIDQCLLLIAGEFYVDYACQVNDASPGFRVEQIWGTMFKE